MVGDFSLRTVEEECRQILEESGARLDVKKTGVHYLLASGLHADTFFQVARVFEKGPLRERMARLMSMRIKAANIDPKGIEILLGPAMGALPLIYTLQHFYDFSHTRAMYAERDPKGEFTISRGFSFGADDTILIIDDVISTFGTLTKTINAAQRVCSTQGWDACVIGCAVCIDRTPQNSKPLNWFAPSLKIATGIRLPLDSYLPEICPSCRVGIKLVRP